MNTSLKKLKPYPFDRLNTLLASVTPADLNPISLALGEPKHASPDFLIDYITSPDLLRKGLATYPPTRGIPELRQAISEFVARRYPPARINPETEVLPVNGTREGLFSVAQALSEPLKRKHIILPNPFYQIYEGACLLAGCQPLYVNSDTNAPFKPDYNAIKPNTWDRVSILYLCNPGNPHGSLLSIAEMQYLIEQALKHGFVIIADECYSEIYRSETSAPPGLLEAAAKMGNTGYKQCLAFNSLSKRSNLPGLRSGYVCGDAGLIESFLLYRTYHGSAMPIHNQLLSSLAWSDEQHVIINRARYREKYTAFLNIINDFWPMHQPEASFYLWPETPYDDQKFAVNLIKETNIRVLPGSYLARSSDQVNPGQNRVRLALVAELDQCIQAAERLRDHWPRLS